MQDKELCMIYGGAFGATYINAIVRVAESIYNLGRSLGSSFYQLRKGKRCSI